MREVLFRGQTRRHGEKVWMNGEKLPSNWVYGGVCQGKGAFSIIYGSYDENLEAPTEKHVVYTDTLGQYTGLTDKNGKKVFEGDILVFCKGATYPYKIEWDGMGWKLYRSDGKRIKEAFECDEIHYVNISEIVGNIYDNPELLKGGEPI